MDLVKSSLKLFTVRILSSFIGFLAVVVFSRELGASPLGSYYPFVALVGIVAIPADFGLRGATEKRLSEGDEAAAFVGTAIALKLGLLLGICLLVLLARPLVNQYLGAELTVAVAVGIVAREAARFSVAVLRGELRVGETAIAQLMQPLGWLVFGYIFYLLGYGVTGLVYGYILGAGAMFAVAWWRVSIRPAWPSLAKARSLFEYGRYSVVSSVGGYFYSWMDVVILSAFVGAGIASSRAAIGAYENAWRLSLLVILFSNAIAKSLFPQISQWSADDAISRIEAVIPKALIASLMLVVPAFVGMAVLSKQLLTILYSPEFVIAWLALIILTGEKILQSVHVIIGRSLQAIDRPDLAAYATIVAIIINFVLNISLIPYLGIAGAALATTVSFTANTALHAYYLSDFVKISVPYRELGWTVVASTLMGLLVFAATVRFQIDSVVPLVATLCLGVFSYFGTLMLYSPIRVRVFETIQMLDILPPNLAPTEAE